MAKSEVLIEMPEFEKKYNLAISHRIAAGIAIAA